MSFVLQVDAERWRSHLVATMGQVTWHPRTELVPVVKGNGYGFGQAHAARAAEALGVGVIATGTVFELEEVLACTSTPVLVLERFDGRDRAAARAWEGTSRRWGVERIVRTVSTLAGLRELLAGPAGTQIVLEGRTSMHRFGFSPDELQWTIAQSDFREAVASGQLVVHGLSLHLPMAQPAGPAGREQAKGTARAQEVLQWCGIWQAQELTGARESAAAIGGADAVWVSHLDDQELAQVRAGTPLPLRVRMGTRLWLGDRPALRAHGSVLAVHPLTSGTRVGYRQRSGPRDGTLVVVSGGTAHGIGLRAPTPAASWRQRAVSAGTGSLDAVGRALSPFSWQGKQRWFAEPPHQHHSMLWLPSGCVIPSIGDEMVADVRFTTSRFDAVLGLD